MNKRLVNIWSWALSPKIFKVTDFMITLFNLRFNFDLILGYYNDCVDFMQDLDLQLLCFLLSVCLSKPRCTKKNCSINLRLIQIKCLSYQPKNIQAIRYSHSLISFLNRRDNYLVSHRDMEIESVVIIQFFIRSINYPLQV